MNEIVSKLIPQAQTFFKACVKAAPRQLQSSKSSAAMGTFAAITGAYMFKGSPVKKVGLLFSASLLAGASRFEASKNLHGATITAAVTFGVGLIAQLVLFAGATLKGWYAPGGNKLGGRNTHEVVQDYNNVMQTLRETLSNLKVEEERIEGQTALSGQKMVQRLNDVIARLQEAQGEHDAQLNSRQEEYNTLADQKEELASQLEQKTKDKNRLITTLQNGIVKCNAAIASIIGDDLSKPEIGLEQNTPTEQLRMLIASLEGKVNQAKAKFQSLEKTNVELANAASSVQTQIEEHAVKADELEVANPEVAEATSADATASKAENDLGERAIATLNLVIKKLDQIGRNWDNDHQQTKKATKIRVFPAIAPILAEYKNSLSSE